MLHPVDVLLPHSRTQALKALLLPQPPKLPLMYRWLMKLEGWLFL